MRIFAITLAGAIGGAALAVAIVYTLAAQGQLPINDRQMQTYMMLHPDLALAMIGRQQQIDDMKKQAQQTAALQKVGQKALFDPKIAFVTGPQNAKYSMVEFYDYDCPYCRASQAAVQKFYEARKNDTRFPSSSCRWISTAPTRCWRPRPRLRRAASPTNSWPSIWP
jgi:protein-disulfide isomerase